MSETGTVCFARRCLFCGHVHMIEVEESLFRRWRDGEHIQRVWPEKTPAERETMISGTCSECWDTYMVSDD